MGDLLVCVDDQGPQQLLISDSSRAAMTRPPPATVQWEEGLGVLMRS